MKKVVFFGGKGGVGKTSCASAFALGRARMDKRVLLVSTDPAHSTGDLFQCKVGKEVRYIEENLYLTEIDGEGESERYLRGILEKSKKIVSPVILGEIKKQIEAASISPGTHEAALFERMGDIITEEDDYDYIVFDTAPTGHTMRLINLPDMLEKWTETLIRRRRKLIRLKEMKSYERNLMEKDEVLNILEKRRDKFKRLGKTLSDEEVCVFNLVLNPEIMALSESQRALEGLKDAGIRVGSVIVNKCLPEGIDEGIWRKKIEEESLVLKTLERGDEDIIRFRMRPNLTPRECIDAMAEVFNISL